jgi:hypothetical protein
VIYRRLGDKSPKMTGEKSVSEDFESTFTHNGLALTEVGEIFRALPSRFRPNLVDAPTSFYFSIDAEEWTVVIERHRCSVIEGQAILETDCFLKTSGEILLGTIRGTYIPGLVDLVSGRIKTNNPLLLQTFRDVFG